MKLIIFAGTPGCGKTSIIKHVINRLKDEMDIVFAKFDCIKTDDEKLISEKYGVESIKRLAGEICPDHYTALELAKIVKHYANRDLLIIETAGLCLRCSPYVKEGLGINVLDITAGHPDRYGPILTEADIIAITKADLISQAEREIFRVNVISSNEKAHIVESNGLTGEGSLDLVEYIKESLNLKDTKLTLKHSMPSAICGYCYGCKIVNQSSLNRRYLLGKDLKAMLPNLNCGKCGFKTCNEFIRASLDDPTIKTRCPFVRKKLQEMENKDGK